MGPGFTGKISFFNTRYSISLYLRFGVVVEQKCFVVWVIYFTRIKATKCLRKAVHTELVHFQVLNWCCEYFMNFDYPVMFLIL